METKISVNRENKYVELTTTINIPFTTVKKGSDFDLDKSRERRYAYVIDLLGAFSKRLISSVTRRMNACIQNLTRHVADIEYCDMFGHIVFARKDGTKGNFNVSSYSVMMDTIETLQNGNWRHFLNNGAMIEQTLKALLNDTEQDHSDEGPFKYSELISLLCEVYGTDQLF